MARCTTAQGSSDHCDESQASSASSDVNEAWSSLFCSVIVSPCLHYRGLGPLWIAQCFLLYPQHLSLSVVECCLLLPPSVLLVQIPALCLHYLCLAASGCLCEHQPVRRCNRRKEIFAYLLMDFFSL